MKLSATAMRLLSALGAVVGLAAAASAAETITVNVYSFDYAFDATTGTGRDPVIYTGDTISWKWVAGLAVPHSVKSIAASGVSFDSGTPTSTSGTTFTKTFNSVGVFPYYCTVHGGDGGSTFTGMGGTITVKQAIAGWTFESATVSGTSTDNGPYTAEFGTLAAGSEARGHHASSSTVWSTVAGNGSAKAYTSEHWAVGDYYQFKTATTGFQSLVFAWDQTRSTTGPTNFSIQYSLDGTSFTTLSSGFAVSSAGFSSGTFAPALRFTPVAIPTDANNKAAVYIRVTCSTGPSGTGGTCRIDNAVISGEAIPCGAVAISDQPDPVSVYETEMIQLSLTASGSSGSLSYQWRKGGSPLSDGGSVSGATTSTLTINPAALGDTGSYDCKITNTCAFGITTTATSNSAAVTVDPYPDCDDATIYNPPDDITVDYGDPTSFFVGASGTGTLSYQWRKDGSPLSDGGTISGATTDTLVISSCDLGDVGAYDCEVTNDCGYTPSVVTSTAAYLTVTCDGPTITDDPDSVTTTSGGTTVLTAASTGTVGPSYQWRKGGSPLSDGGRISGSSTDTLTINPTGYADEGSYDVVVTSPCGTATSAAATVTTQCGPDCDTNHFLNVNDFICFKFEWDSHTAYGDYDHNGKWNVRDFTAFQVDFNRVLAGGGCLN